MRKATYRTPEDADATLAEYRARVALMIEEMVIYKCKFGKHWHIGHVTERKEDIWQ